ncbi:MAG TPA: asparagine synthase-related protein [Pseudonocardiaceae bacterium]
MRPRDPWTSPHRGISRASGGCRRTGGAHRIQVELAAGQGVALHAPYLDDAVVAACLAVPAAERTSPRQAKPLLRAAMTGHVPDAALVRSTKGDYSMLAYRGLSRHRSTVGDLLTNSRLAGLGYLPRGSMHLTPITSGALVLLDTRSGRMFQLNPTGASAWNALVGCCGDRGHARRDRSSRPVVACAGGLPGTVPRRRVARPGLSTFG